MPTRRRLTGEVFGPLTVCASPRRCVDVTFETPLSLLSAGSAINLHHLSSVKRGASHRAQEEISLP